MRIACLLDNGYEDSEFQQPYDAFKAEGHEVVVIGLKTGEILGKKGKSSTVAEQTIDQVSPLNFDALFIPGGYSPDHLRANDRAVDFVYKFSQLERPMMAICHGAQLLLTADAIHGRKITAWKTVQDDLKRAGEAVVDAEVVVDSGLISSRQPSDIPAFIRESLLALKSPAKEPRPAAV